MGFTDRIRQAGIVGAGGAGFPTYLKLDSSPDTVIVNGAECEPLLRVDQQLMAVYAEKLSAALEEVRKAVGAEKAVFALKGKYHGAMDALNEAVKKYRALEVFELGNFYPAGDEQVTVYEVTGRIIPEGAIPIAVGVAVLNVETLLNIGRALEDEPVTHKYLTVTGEVVNPVTIRVPLGISVAEAINLAGGATVSDPVYIDGGPMMGKTGDDLEKPVTKTTKGIIVLSSGHPWIREKNRSLSEMMRHAAICCCHCMLCTEVCPRNMLGHGLSPDRLMRIASYGSMCTGDEAVTSAFLCTGCAACAIGCNMGLQPYKLNQELKQRLSANGVKNPHHDQPEYVNPFREFKKMSISSILRRTGLSSYDRPAPFTETEYSPIKVTLSLKQHIGAPSVPCVEKGDKVTAGDIIAHPAEKGPGIFYHSSIDGRVLSADDGVIVVEA